MKSVHMRTSLGHEMNWKARNVKSNFSVYVDGYRLCVQVCVLTPPSGIAWYDMKRHVMTSHIPGNWNLVVEFPEKRRKCRCFRSVGGYLCHRFATTWVKDSQQRRSHCVVHLWLCPSGMWFLLFCFGFSGH